MNKNVIELARFRGKVESARRPPAPPDGTIIIRSLPDGTHSYNLTGQYARSIALTTRTLAQLIEEINAG